MRSQIDLTFLKRENGVDNFLCRTCVQSDFFLFQLNLNEEPTKNLRKAIFRVT